MAERNHAHQTPVPVCETRIEDALFLKYLDAVADHVLSYQWEALNDRIPGLEKSHCIENFRIAAGEAEGRHEGAVFQDTDLYKWLEAVAFCIAGGRGLQYQKTAEEAIALIGRAQEADGYLNTYFTVNHPDRKWTNLTEGHELYSGGHMIEAAVAWHDATGRDDFLTIARRFADLVDRTFGPGEGQLHGIPGHPEIELALVKLARATGEKRYEALADYFVRRRGQKPDYLAEELKGNREQGRLIFPEFVEWDAAYAQNHLPVLEQTEAVGHAVRAAYLYSAMADLAADLKDPELARACRTLFDNIIQKRMYLTGGIGSSGKLERFTADYDLPNDRTYCESCASIGLMMFGQRMAGLTGEASCYDAVERALYNTVLAGISIEGDRYFYVNPLEVWPDNCLPSTSMSHVKPVRQTWFACACCPPNIARTLASLGQYVYAKSDSALYVNLFVSSRTETVVGDGLLRLSMASSWMQDGTVCFHAEHTGRGAAFKLRLPYWLRKPVLTVDGRLFTPTVESGYAVVPVSGAVDVELHGGVPAHFVAASRNVRADAGKIALEKGPVVYCLEETDNGGNLACLSVSPAAKIREGAPLEGFPGGLPTLELAGQRLTGTTAEDGVLYGTPAFAREPVELRAVPYAQWCNREPGEMLVWIRAEI